MDFDKLYKLFENNETQILKGFHGSQSDNLNINSEKPLWFVTNLESEILKFYGMHGNVYSAELTLGNNLDLLMYDTDDMLDYSETKEFLIDCELNSIDIKSMMTAAWDNREANTIMLTNVLNNALLYTELPNQFDSIIINENGEQTICMINHSLIKNVMKI
jgi:hypothetical protein